MDAGILVGCGLLVGGVGVAGAAFGDQERVTRLWARVDIGVEGSAQVSEVIDYDFGALATDKHGIYRIVPDLDPAAPIDVSSPTAPDDVAVTSEAAGTRIRIGDAARTVSGRHRYAIDYPLPAMVTGDDVAWDAVGTGWTVPVEEAEIHLVAPFELQDLRCDAGGTGDTGGCEARTVEPGHVVVEAEDLASGEGVTVYATTGDPVAPPAAEPEAPADPPAETGAGLLPPGATAAAAALVAAVPATLVVRRAGRERVAAGGAADAAFAAGPGWPAPPGGPVPGELRVDSDELGRLATTEFAPPEHLTAAQGGSSSGRPWATSTRWRG